MTEDTRFERRLEELLIEDAATVDGPVDAAAIMHRAAFTPRNRLGRLGISLVPPSPTVIRMGLLFAVLVALLGAFIVGRSRAVPNAADLVRRSGAVLQDPPPFAMTTTPFDIPGDNSTFHVCDSSWFDETDLETMLVDYAYDGVASYRQTCRVDRADGTDPPDAWIVVGPDGEGTWSGLEWMNETEYGYRDGAPLATVEWLNWANVALFVPQLDVDACSWRLAGREEVIGRTTWLVSCDGHTFWIDEESLFILKRAYQGTIISEALAFEVGASPPASFFALGPPADARQRLTEGRSPVVWTLPTVTGDTYSWSSRRDRPSVVLMRSYCAPECLPLTTFTQAVLPWLDEVNAIVYGLAADGFPLDTAAGTATRLGFVDQEIAEAIAAGIPIVLDEGSGGPAWESDGSSVELFDGDGVLVADRMPLQAASLRLMIEALVAGQPIPTVSPQEILFEVGSPAPPLEVTLLEGGTFDHVTASGSRLAVLATSAVDEADTIKTLGAFADACALDDTLTCLVLPGRPPYASPTDWPALYDRVAGAGHPIDRVQLAAPRQPEVYWAALLQWDFAGSADLPDRRALVTVDRDGLVETISIDPSIDQAEITRVLHKTEDASTTTAS